MSVKIGSARIDENGRAKGGKAGDQNGREVSTQSWYKHSKGWRVFRAKDPAVAEDIAQDMQWACDNRHIGYDQGQRLSLYDVAKPLGFNCKRVDTNCETDCSALVRVCCAYAGVSLPNFRTPTEPAALIASGAFTELKSEKYTDSEKYLKRGDILVTRTQGHTVVVLSNGSGASGDDPRVAYLSRGDVGPEVAQLQRLLLRWDGGCLPRYGVDGDFGSETEKAVKAFQREKGLTVNGLFDPPTERALATAVGDRVAITGESVNVRSEPGTDGAIIGVVHRGDRLAYLGQARKVGSRDWYRVRFLDVDGWVSGKYAVVVAED